MRKPSVVFMGTPQFAVPSLEILIRNGYPVKAVVTAADKPAGRGLKTREPAVKVAALAKNIPVLQPASLKDDEFVNLLRSFSADIFIVVAFRMLPEKVWSLPTLGTVNLHASLLPLYRGAAPINHAIINGEKITGVTTFLIEKEIDTGKILLREKTEIGDAESAGDLHDRLMYLGAELILKTVRAISENQIVPVPQLMAGDVPVAPKLTKAGSRINWSDPVEKVYNFIRGLSPYPGAWTMLFSAGRSVNLKILETEKIAGTELPIPGKVVVKNEGMVISATDGYLLLKRVQAEGRKAMTGHEFLRGFRPGPDAFCNGFSSD
jgi:methionyl-tRNA formyltransferase